MSKKVQKTLTGAMAAMMATGVVATPAMAATNTNVDALYKAAYQATQKALTEKTQASINEARKAIKALPANLDWAIGEFSKQVDTVQQPIFSNIVKLIKKAEKEPTQANINAARKAIPAELAPVWRNSYSSAVDKVQQGLQQKAVDAVKKAEADKTQENVDAAKVLVNDLLTADSQGIKDWAKTLLNRVEAIKIYDIDVTKVTEITRYNVEVEFDKLPENLKDVSIEVIDSNGKTHEVYAKNILKGSKVSKFEFRSVAGITELKGVWIVNGVEYNFDEINLVSSLKASLDTNKDFEKSLVALEKAGYINGLLGEYDKDGKFTFDTFKNGTETVNMAEQYEAALKAALKADKFAIKNAGDVQKIIDKVNSDLEGNVSFENLVKLLEGSATDRQVYNAMVELGLEKLNADWIGSYIDEMLVEKQVDGKKVTEVSEDIKEVKDVQNVVYEVNADKIGIIEKFIEDHVIDTMDSSSIKAAKTGMEDKIALIEDYHKDDADKVTTKADSIHNLEVAIALLDVKAISDETDLSAALKNLSDVVNDKDVFNYNAHINESLMADYFKGIGEAKTVRTATTPESVRDLAKDIQAVAITDEIGKVANADSADNLLKALKAERLGLKNVVDANKDEYFKDEALFVEKDTVTTVQNKVDAINARLAMKNATTKAELKTALLTLVNKMDSEILDVKSTGEIDDIVEEFLRLRDEKDATKKVTLETVNVVVGTDFGKVTGEIKDKLDAVKDGLIAVDHKGLEDALKAIAGKDAIKPGMVVDFVNASKTDNGYKDYKTYSQVRKALGL